MKRQTRRTGITLAVLIFIISADITMAQVSKADPEAKKVLNNYVKAIGGKKAVSQVQNISSKVDQVFTDAGITINKESIEERSGKIYIKAFAPQFGEIIRGYDGETCWEKRQGGVRVIYDEEKTNFLNGSAFLRYANWENILSTLDHSGMVRIDSINLHKLSVTTIYGSREYWYFNAADNLLTLIEELIDQPEGSITVTTTFEDYREVNGVLHSFTQYIDMQGPKRKIIFHSILHNQPVDISLFSKPLQ